MKPVESEYKNFRPATEPVGHTAIKPTENPSRVTFDFVLEKE